MVMCCLETNKGELRMEMNKLLEDYGCLAFSDDVMKERIPKSIYKAFHESLDNGEELSKECATVIANAMKIWALEIYAENKKRFVVTPKDRMGFIEAIVAANKRIHVQCTEYAATHRSYEKKRKRALKEEAKKANMDAE